MKSEFQAVVLAAGRGTRLPEVTSGFPKALLPVGNFPLVFYPLNMLQQHGIIDIILVVMESQKVTIQQRLEKEKTLLKLNIEYATIKDENDYGTAESLGSIAEKYISLIISSYCFFFLKHLSF
jgi:translation initiation factor eIF-2B subunit gamma